ncbi:MAG: secondary thiamine-phosphate synthase enzyme YjbQ [Candidatus Thermoplasmatota archaeon]
MKEIDVRTDRQLEVQDITSKVRRCVEDVEEGVVTAYVLHTTAALTIQEDDRELWEDLLNTYKRLVPLKGDYEHNAKYSKRSGEQNAHAHILASLIQPSVHIPIEDGELGLGTWQKILFVELDGGRHRKVMVKVLSG